MSGTKECAYCGRPLGAGAKLLKTKERVCARCAEKLAKMSRRGKFKLFIWGKRRYQNLLAGQRAKEIVKLQRLGLRLSEDGLFVEGTEQVAWDQVGGYEDIEREIKESIVLPLKRPDLAEIYAIRPVKGILLFGPPGCGKTLLMRALSHQLDFHLIYIKCSDIMSKFYGESEQRISEIFSSAREIAPCILFFDELDGIGGKRYNHGDDSITPKLLSLLLYEMDGITPTEEVIVVGSTNAPQILDSALIRPGRLDKLIYVPPPNVHAREEIFKIHLTGKPLARNVDYKRLAKLTERYSGADIANVCEEAARLAAEKAMKTGKIEKITYKDISRVLTRMRASVTFHMLDTFNEFRLDFERRSILGLDENVGNKTRWEDVYGLEDAKRALTEAVELPLVHSEMIRKYNVTQQKGVFLFGPSGCGKTMLVRAAANKLNVALVNLSGSDLSKSRYKDAANIIKESFYRARENPPSILCMDDIDSLTSDQNLSNGPSRHKAVSEILIHMDGISELRDVVIVATTNRPEAVDSALLRPGRFDKILFIPLPDQRIRQKIFNAHLENMPLAPEITVEKLSSLTNGFSGADIVYICNEAKMNLIRAELERTSKDYLTLEDFVLILEKVHPSVTQEQLQKYQQFLQSFGR